MAAIMLLAAGLPAAAAPLAVELGVQESLGIARPSAPISGGVPLPKGAFDRNQSFALLAADGREIACQVLPLVVASDGTLRWVLVDFQDDLAAGATNGYVLRAAEPKARPAVELKVEDTAGAVTVDTGKIRFTVAKDRPFGLLSRVEVGGRPVVTGGEVSFVELAGRSGWDDKSAWTPARHVAGPPDAVTVRYAGPLRATLEIRGRFEGVPGADYAAWITAWAGRSDVWVKYKLGNSNPEQYTARLIKRSTITLNLAAPAGKTVLGAKEPIAAGADGWLHQGLCLHHTYQDIAGAVRAGSGERTLWTGGGPADRPGGWIAVTAGPPVLVCDALFSTDPARRLAVRGDRLELDGIAERFDGPKDQKFREDRRVGEPWKAEGRWLYDCSHHSSEYLIDFAPPADPEALSRAAEAARNRLWALAPGRYYSQCEAVGSGHFATLDEEMDAYRRWGWTWQPGQVPDHSRPMPAAFVAAEDNHYESEADSAQGLLLMYLRTGQRGWFDQAESWARYHADLQAWRTDGWRWKDGGIWFPSGGPQGNMPVRAKWNFAWGPNWGERKNDPDCADLWRHSMSKSCYCHFYGSGLVDYYCLTGDPDALAAAIDNVEQKDDEFRHFKQFKPGESAVGSIRGFGRGFEVMMRVLEADPDNAFVADLCRLCAQTLWQSPLLDERGFHCSQIGGGGGGMAVKELTPAVRQWMQKQGITYTTQGDTVDTLTKDGRTWKVHAMGGTWQHVYIQNGAEMYARHFGDDDMRDFAIAFAQLSAKYMLSPKCHQTWYYTFFDAPDYGMVFDPWVFEHTATSDGEGCVHSGWYTRFYPDACAKGFSLSGERRLLDRGKEFWYYGSKRAYQTKNLRGGPDEVGMFLGHTPPKDDTVLGASRLLYEASHPRADDQPPSAVGDLAVKLLGDGKAEVSLTAPADAGGGSTASYQVKADALPIVPYEKWDYVADSGQKRNWWRAANCRGEPAPARPGSKERFVVSGVPAGQTLYFAVRTFDDSGNRSAMSNVAVARD